MMNNTMTFEQLPMDVQEEVKRWLRVYDVTYVDFANGEYKVSSSVCLTATYAPDHRCIGEYHAKDVFTEEERILNYILTFYCYPVEYTGKRDYLMLKKLQEREWLDGDHKAYRTWTGELIDGDFEITGQIVVDCTK